MAAVPFRREQNSAYGAVWNYFEVAMKYQWILPETSDSQNAQKISRQFNIHPVIAQILQKREIDSAEKLQRFLHPSLNQLYDPFLLDDMDVAVKRIIRALQDGENILIYGDYDVDGVTSVSILYDGLFRLGGKVSFFIPNRFKEGYGVSQAGIRIAKRKKASLIIAVDCGITAVKEVALAKEFGIDFIVCDHHEPGDILPEAVAIVDAKRKDSQYPFKELAGCGVAFKVLQAIGKKLGLNDDFATKYLDLVALGTAADIVQLTDENRILVKNGLGQMNVRPRPGLAALIKSCGLGERVITVSNIVFVIAPRLNAVGRISSAKKAVHLLTAVNPQRARNIARILENENKKRKSIDEITFEAAIKIIEETYDLEKTRVIVVAGEDWHPGVIGIVASRLMEKYSRPTVLISIQDGVGKGSARSLPSFDIYAAFKELQDFLINFGGHRFAAGLTILPENIPQFTEELNRLAESFLHFEELVPKLFIDAEIMFNQLNGEFFNDLKALAPFGPGNMRPVLLTRALQIYGQAAVVGANHIKVKFKQDTLVLDAIGYNLAQYIEALKQPDQQVDCAYVLEETKWSGQTTIQMKIKDFEVGKRE